MGLFDPVHRPLLGGLCNSYANGTREESIDVRVLFGILRDALVFMVAAL